MSKPQFNTRAFFFGALAALVPSIAAAWAFATIAAEHVLAPHREGAKIRIRIMCRMAEIQNENQHAICEQLGAKCTSYHEAVELIAECKTADE